ncbi:MAG: hypothetical protein KIT14_01190 [bacterium]|nr:hypothetical protein [bacterium]
MVPRFLSTVLFVVLLATAARAAGPLPPLPPPDPECTLYTLANLGEDCIYQTPTVVETTTQNPKFALAHDVGIARFGTANVCGDLACSYWGVGWRLFGSGLSLDPEGVCTSYAGLESAGTPTRPITGTPGSCALRYDPSNFDMRSPGQWKLVNFFLTSGSSPQQAASYLVGVRPELWKLSLQTSDPIDGRPAGGALAVRHDADPVRSACISPISWLPDRIVPECVVMQGSQPSYSNWLPNGAWDVYTFHGSLPAAGAKVRQALTPWPPRAVTIADADKELAVQRVPRPQVAVTIELLGGDDLLRVDEDGTVRVIVATTSAGVAGTIDELTFYPATTQVVQLNRPSGGGFAEITGNATPVPQQPGFSMGPGEVRTFDTPIRGTGPGAMNLRVTLYGRSPFFDSRDVVATKQIQIIPVGTPTTTTPPPTEACGQEIVTFVKQTTTGSALPVKSAAGIQLGDELIVDPCTENAEQITVAGVTGDVLAVGPALVRIHLADEPIIRADPNGTMLKSPAAAGDAELDVLDSSIFTVGDAVLVDPGTSSEERRFVTGFGSILIDQPLAYAHGVGAAVVLEVPSVSTTTTVPPGGTTTTTLPDPGCEAGATLDAAACRVAALFTQTEGLAAGKPRTQLLAKVKAAGAAIEKARVHLGAGKTKPARASLRKAAKALTVFGKKLRSKKVAKALPEAERARLAEALGTLVADLKALGRTAAP